MKRHRKRKKTGKYHSHFEDIIMRRKPARNSHNAFKRRARQTARINTLTPLRGGIRL